MSWLRAATANNVPYLPLSWRRHLTGDGSLVKVPPAVSTGRCAPEIGLIRHQHPRHIRPAAIRGHFLSPSLTPAPESPPPPQPSPDILTRAATSAAPGQLPRSCGRVARAGRGADSAAESPQLISGDPRTNISQDIALIAASALNQR